MQEDSIIVDSEPVEPGPTAVLNYRLVSASAGPDDIGYYSEEEEDIL